MNPTRRNGILLALALVLFASSLAAHELFLKFTTYFVPPNSAVEAVLLNGTFVKSENAIIRSRIAEVRLVGGNQSPRLDTSAVIPQRDSTTRIRFRTAEEGTYVLGLSVRPNEIALTGQQFNGYLKEEGLDEVLAERTRAGDLAKPAKERYAKHVKAVFQVGEPRTDQFGTVFGYPAEIVPLDNPYRLTAGDSLRVRCFVKGQATGSLAVLAGGLDARGTRIKEVKLLTDASGMAVVPLGTAGRWYVKFISMRPSSEPGLTHESQWATLTFQVR